MSLRADDGGIPPMDHAAGHKPSAFTWAMGRLILERMAARETMKAITAPAGWRSRPSWRSMT